MTEIVKKLVAVVGVKTYAVQQEGGLRRYTGGGGHVKPVNCVAATVLSFFTYRNCKDGDIVLRSSEIIVVGQ